MEFQNYTAHQSDWMTFLILGILFFYGLFHYFGALNIKTLITAVLSSKFTFRKPNKLINFILKLNTLAVVALFVFTALEFIHKRADFSVFLFLRVVFGLLVLIGFQRLLNYIHSGITKTTSFLSNYLSIQNQFAHLAAIFALPFLIISLYSKWFSIQMLIVGATVLGGIYLFGILKSIATGNRIKGPLKFHLIFYLCGNEILPFFLFYKLLI